MTAGKRRIPLALVTDLPVLVLLVLAWATVAVFWAHVVTGLLLVAVIGIHLRTRPHLPLRPLRTTRDAGYAVFLVAATAMVGTGLLRWLGVPAQHVWHGGISYLVLGLVLAHLWSVRRVLRTRIVCVPARNDRSTA
jgi:hypothetical protein